MTVERELVSDVWARDWDCPEDAVYDDADGVKV